MKIATVAPIASEVRILARPSPAIPEAHEHLRGQDFDIHGSPKRVVWTSV